MNGIRQELRATFDSSAGEMQARQERTDAIRADSKQLFGFLGDSSAEKRAAVFGKDESSMTRQQKYSKLTTTSLFVAHAPPLSVARGPHLSTPRFR